MKTMGHVATSLIAGGILYKFTHSSAAFLWVLIIGIFIDLDHYIDYVREIGVGFNPKKIYSTCKYGTIYFKKLTLALHSYELMIILWIAIFIFDLNIVWKCAAISFSLHLFIDQIANPVMPLTYFFLFRMANHFETKKIFITHNQGGV